MALTFFSVWAGGAQAQNTPPASLRGAIDEEHSGVDWITTAELASLLEDAPDSRPVLLDVRAEAEFAQSHLHGAIRVEPGATNVDSLGLSGRQVVVYCSVGYRSAALMPVLRAARVASVRNLVGGIFQWANEGRLLCDANGRASRVHPYDAEWGRYLIDERRAPLAR